MGSGGSSRDAGLAHDLNNADSATAELLDPIAAGDVYEQVTGQRLPDERFVPWPSDPAGERIDLKQDDVVRARFPRLWELRRARLRGGTP